MPYADMGHAPVRGVYCLHGAGMQLYARMDETRFMRMDRDCNHHHAVQRAAGHVGLVPEGAGIIGCHEVWCGL